MFNPNESEKKQLLLVCGGTVLLLGLFWWLVIRTEQREIQRTRTKAADLVAQSEADRQRATRWEAFQQAFGTSSNRLQKLEANVPVGDVFRWQLRTFLRPVAVGVEVIEVEPPDHTESGLLPATIDKLFVVTETVNGVATQTPKKKTFPLPYHEYVFTIKGRAEFHNFGRFLADLENEYVNLRVERLELEPALPDGLDSPDAKKLLFQIDFLTLAKTSSVPVSVK